MFSVKLPYQINADNGINLTILYLIYVQSLLLKGSCLNTRRILQKASKS
jgi:hypothetical protein